MSELTPVSVTNAEPEITPLPGHPQPTTVVTPAPTPAVTVAHTTPPVQTTSDDRVVLETPIFVKKENFDPTNITVSLPSELYKKTEESINSMPNVDFVNTDEDRSWARVSKEGLDLNTLEEAFVKALNRTGSMWRQSVDTGGDKLSAKAPSFKDTTNTELKGERGTIRILSKLGIGTIFQVPLYHTGIWITFKAPTEGFLLELYRTLIADKIAFGRSTYGLAFSNTTSYTTDRFVSAALEHVYDCSLDRTNITSLKDIISAQDIPTLIWGFACTMFPKGFQYERACLADPEKCNHVERETLNVTKLQLVDTSMLSDWHRIHMATRRPNSKTPEQIQQYKETLIATAKRKVVINKDTEHELGLMLRIPTISEYIDSGYRWISEVVNIVESSLTVSDEKDKSTFITRHGQATSMRQYAHWVERIDLDNDNFVSATETIEEVFNALSTDDKIRNEFIEAVLGYIDETNISIIAIPNYECSSCGKEQPVNHKLDNFESVLPLDPIPLFSIYSFRKHDE